MKKAAKCIFLAALVLSTGRCERIRTFDPLHPMQVRYQAAPHTETGNKYNRLPLKISGCYIQEITNIKQFLPQENWFSIKG